MNEESGKPTLEHILRAKLFLQELQADVTGDYTYTKLFHEAVGGILAILEYLEPSATSTTEASAKTRRQ